MSYGKHQSFYIRNNWISKGINALSEFGGSFFFDINSNYMKIGLGKNMFESLKYWLEATNIVEIDKKEHKLTIFGEYIKKYDKGCKQMFTLNLLHYFLVCEEKPNYVDKSESYFWYFNIYEEPYSRREKIVEELIKWDLETHSKATSESTLKKDIDSIISSYTKSNHSHPEDKMTSVLSSLSIIKIQDGLIVKNQIEIEKIDYDAIMYILLRLNEKNRITSLSSLLNEIESPGRIFNISRTDLIEIIECMISKAYPLKISRTNNLDTIVITESISSVDFLRSVKGDKKNDN